jgi:acyl dehydratase
MLDKKYIGLELGSHEFEIEPGHLKFFNRVIGQTNPVFTDEAAAISAGYPGLPVPPSFYFTMYLEQENVWGWLDTLGVELADVLHGSQDFAYHRPAFAGQTVTLTAKITDIFEKKGGTLGFVIKKITVSDAAGYLLATQKVTLVMRRRGGNQENA